MPAPETKRNRRRTVIILLAVGILLLVAVVFTQAAFNLNPFFRPETNQQTFVLAALSALIFLLLVALSFVLFRTLLKLYTERRVGALGSKFRTKMALGALVLSSGPVIFMFLFAYGLMNRSIDKWFSRPVEEVRQDTAAVASLLSGYAAADANGEAESIAASAETQRAFLSGNFSGVLSEFRRQQSSLHGGFGLAIREEHAEASYNAPDTWPVLLSTIPALRKLDALPASAFEFNGKEYMLGSARVGANGYIVVGLPLPPNFSSTLKAVQASENRYYELSRQRKLVRRTYMGMLLLITVVVLFASTWFALVLAKLVTRPVTALAAATQEISRGHLDYRVEVPAADELGQLVHSFNRMAEELENSRQQLEASTQSLGEANVQLEQRRRHMETILESIPTGVLSLDAQRRVTHTNDAFNRIFKPALPSGNGFPTGARLEEVLPQEVAEDLRYLLRKSDRMGTTTRQMEVNLQRSRLNLAVTVASLQHEGQRLGYVVVFEDLSDLLKAQKQAAWREVARRVAHEIKNPLTPIALSAERIRRHLERGVPPDDSSLAVMHGCAATIAGAVETVRTLVDEFSTLARFPTANPQPSDINAIVESALAMFDGRLENVRVRTFLAPDLPKIVADPEAIKRAIANLVDNAAEAVQDSLVREVQISTGLVGARDTVEIVVADSGHGVSQELKEKLFMPYFSTKKRGTGLGLSIVSRIVEDHHGSIRVEENWPVGARFIMELPVAPEAAGAASS